MIGEMEGLTEKLKSVTIDDGGYHPQDPRVATKSQPRPRRYGTNHKNTGDWAHRTPRQTQQTIHQDFASLHRKIKSGKYKIHEPGCSCTKLVNLRKKAASRGITDDARFDGFVVIPDTSSKQLANVFVCPQTTKAAFDKDRVATELRLQQALFPPQQHPPLQPRYKVNCAACLLRVEPNGFVSIQSSSRAAVQRVCDIATATAVSLQQQQHDDHGDFVAVVSYRKLKALRRAKTRGAKEARTRDVWDELRQQTGVEGDTRSPPPVLKVEHHLEALLDLSSEPGDGSDNYLLVMGYYADWALNLPGGKRRLGESTWECAKRETMEEISLVLDDAWTVVATVEDDCNAYFLIDPKKVTEVE